MKEVILRKRQTLSEAFLGEAEITCPRTSLPDPTFMGQAIDHHWTPLERVEVQYRRITSRRIRFAHKAK